LSRPALTDRQAEILAYVADAIRRGRPPTLREIGDFVSIKSLNSVYDHLQRLEAKGYIQRGRGARNVVLVHAEPMNSP